MRFEDIKNLFPQAKYYKLKKRPAKSMLQIEKMEDYFQLTQRVGYFEIRIEKEAASQLFLESLVESYLHSVHPGIGPQHPLSLKFLDFVNEHMPDELRLILETESITFIDLYGIDLDVMFEDERDGTFLSDETFEQGLNIMSDIFETYKKDLDKQAEERENEINVFILSFKDEYLQLKSKADKEDFIKKVQVELKKKFNIDSRSDYRVSKASIRILYGE